MRKFYNSKQQLRRNSRLRVSEQDMNMKDLLKYCPSLFRTRFNNVAHDTKIHTRWRVLLRKNYAKLKNACEGTEDL